MHKKISRVLLIGLLAVAAVLLAGCATTKPLFGFIATKGYVDQQMKAEADANQKSLDKIQADLKTLQQDVNQYQDQTQQIKSIADEIAKTKDETKQLQELASTVGDRIAGLPRTTLLQLSELIQKGLAQDTGASTATSTK